MTADATKPPHALSRHPAGSYRELLTVAVPLMLSAATQSLMHLIDRIFLSWHAREELAAALPAGVFYWSCLSLPFGIASYVNTFVAQYDGANKPDRVAAAVWQGVYFAVGAGALMMLIAPWADVIFTAIGHSPSIARAEATYFRWLCMGGIPAVLHPALSAFFSGRGRTYVVLGVNVFCVAISAVLDYAFIFGWGPIPEWGIAGAAMTDVIGTSLGVGILGTLILSSRTGRQYPFRQTWSFDRVLQWDLLKFGGPNGLQMLIDVGGFAAFMMIIGWIGENELAATNIAFTLNSMSFIPVIGVGIAASTLVGQRIGDGHPELAAVSTWKAFVIAGGYMLIFGAVYTLLPDLLIVPFAGEADPEEFAELHRTIVILLRFVALYSFFDAMAIIFGSAIRGAGDTRFAMITACLSASLLLVVPTYAVWHFHGPNLFWSWTICSVYVVSLGFIYLTRFQLGYWKSMNVIHRDEPPTDDSDPGQDQGDSESIAVAVVAP